MWADDRFLVWPIEPPPDPWRGLLKILAARHVTKDGREP